MDRESDFKLFAKYTSFNIMSMIGLSCYILADTYFIARGLGENGLAALNIAIPAYSFINGIGLMLGIGGGTKYAINKALAKEKECDHIFIHMLYAAIFFAFIFMLLGLTRSDEVSFLLGSSVETLNMTSVYVKITLLFSPAFMINNILNCFVKNDGEPKLAMVAMLCGSIFNIIFDYIFIFPMNLGMAGAAMATGASPVVGILILSIHFFRKNNNFHFCRAKLNFKFYRQCLPLGVPALITELSSGLVIVIFNILILKSAGNIGVAAYGIIANISLVVVAVYTGIAQGIQPVLSDAFGKRLKSRIKNVVAYGVITSLIISIVVYGLLFIKADYFAMLFNRDQNMELQKIAINGIRMYFAAIPFVGFNIITASYFASVEQKIPAQLVSVLRGFVILIPFVFIMSKIWKLNGIWLSFPATELITSIIAVLCFVSIRNQNNKSLIKR